MEIRSRAYDRSGHVSFDDRNLKLTALKEVFMGEDYWAINEIARHAVGVRDEGSTA